jgi:hypothetical protein
VLSAALASVIDSQPWGQAKSAVIEAYDPLEDSTKW